MASVPLSSSGASGNREALLAMWRRIRMAPEAPLAPGEMSCQPVSMKHTHTPELGKCPSQHQRNSIGCWDKETRHNNKKDGRG